MSKDISAFWRSDGRLQVAEMGERMSPTRGEGKRLNKNVRTAFYGTFFLSSHEHERRTRTWNSEPTFL